MSIFFFSLDILLKPFQCWLTHGSSWFMIAVALIQFWKKKNQNRNTSNNIVSFLFCMNSGISFKILFLTGAEKETGIRHVLQKCWMVWEMGVMHVSKGTRLHWIPRINKQIRCGSPGNYTSFLLFLQYFNRSACKVHGTRKSKIQTREKKN